MKEQLYEIIDIIRPRPKIFLGVAGVTPLRNFLDGYLTALGQYFPQANTTVLPPLPFWFFHEYVKVRCGFDESTSSWNNMILNRSGGNEEQALKEFYRLYDGFRALRLESCRTATLDEKNRHFHVNESGISRTVGDGTPGPCYPDAEKVYILELTDGIGYLVLVEMRQTIEIEYHIYRKESAVMEHVERFFGKVENWMLGNVERLEFQKPIC